MHFHVGVAVGFDRFNETAGGGRVEDGFERVGARLAQRPLAERARLRPTRSDGALNLMRRAEEEIHVGRLHLGALGLFEISLAARFGVFDVIRVVGVGDDLVGAHLVGFLRDVGVAVERDAVRFLFKQGAAAAHARRFFRLKLRRAASIIRFA